MGFKRLLRHGKVIRDGRGRYRYEIIVRVGGRQVKKRIWAADDNEALRHQDLLQRSSGMRLRWQEGLDLWKPAHLNCAEGYVEDVV